ncbi:hypothetical protein [Teredinibacter turnerae]|uniref:hypothetical protein n=1 Tax=Teredinibacter turnerae TaxID=2426 RepID=UPI00036EE26C|nr:hypothetical protein [Teredinibacter turnerae]
MNLSSLKVLNPIVSLDELKKYEDVIGDEDIDSLILKVDHISLGTKSINLLRKLYSDFLYIGGSVLEDVHRWPAEQKDTPIEFHKNMFSLELNDFFVVGVSPGSKNDQIDKFMNGEETTKIHHIAFLVRNFNLAIEMFKDQLDFRCLDCAKPNQGDIRQVFLIHENRNILVEIVWRSDVNSKNLIHKNIVTLSSSLEAYKNVS